MLNIACVMVALEARSGKTLILIYAIIVRACKEKSRHVILRSIFNHAKTSIWMDTLPKILNIAFPTLKVIFNKSDYYIRFPNGSEVWVDGLDCSDRVEKILGKEYSTIYFNECSQIDYSSIQVALTRLAEKNNLVKKVYYDCNPPTKRHWSYWLFIKGIAPDTSEQVEKENYKAILMNPSDNKENIDEDYVNEVLEKLPEKQRARFLLGEFVDDSDGCAYYEFNRDLHVKDCNKLPGSILIGMDFNVMPMTCVIAQVENETIKVIDEVWLENSDTFKMSFELRRRGFGGSLIYPDSTGANRKTSGKSDHAILKDDGFNVIQTRNPLVFDRVNNMNRLFKDNRIIIDSKCKHLIADLEKVSWKDNQLDQKTDKMLTHVSDSLAYLCWSLYPITNFIKPTSKAL